MADWSTGYQILQQGLSQYGQNRRRREELDYARERDQKSDERNAKLDQAQLDRWRIDMDQAMLEHELKKQEKERQKAFTTDFSQAQATPFPVPGIGPEMPPVMPDMTQPFHAQPPQVQQAAQNLTPKGVLSPAQIAELFNQQVQASTGRPVLPEAPAGMKPSQYNVGGMVFEPDLSEETKALLAQGARPESVKVGNATYQFPQQAGPAQIQPVLDMNGNPMPGLYTGPDGKPHPLPRSAAPTEAQSNARIYAERMGFIEDVLGKLEKEYDPTSLLRLPQESPMPFGVGDAALRTLRSDEANQYIDAKKNWIAATLRKESGAAISESEYHNADKQYFPQIGDSPETIAQKKALRQLVRSEMESIGNPPQVELPGFGDMPVDVEEPTLPGAESGEPVVISTQAEFDRLQPGTKFVFNGRVGTKH